jgi:hypothetical protein
MVLLALALLSALRGVEVDASVASRLLRHALFRRVQARAGPRRLAALRPSGVRERQRACQPAPRSRRRRRRRHLRGCPVQLRLDAGGLEAERTGSAANRRAQRASNPCASLERQSAQSEPACQRHRRLWSVSSRGRICDGKERCRLPVDLQWRQAPHLSQQATPTLRTRAKPRQLAPRRNRADRTTRAADCGACACVQRPAGPGCRRRRPRGSNAAARSDGAPRGRQPQRARPQLRANTSLLHLPDAPSCAVIGRVPWPP